MAALSVIAVLLAVLAAVLLVLAATLLLEVVASFLPEHSSDTRERRRPRLAVLIPAHNEAGIIAATLGSVRAQLGPEDRVLVIADNCTDETAAIAQALGAEVAVRSDPLQRGKSYGLAFGMCQLASDPPEVVAVVDADCLLGPGCLAKIATASTAYDRPVQAHYALTMPPQRSTYLAVASFAWAVKNYVRPLGLHRLGLPCQIMGTGFAVPWRQLAAVNLGTGELAEDMVLGIDLARASSAPMFCPSANISSGFPTSTEGQQAQRARWETGHLRTIGVHLPSALAEALVHRDLNLLMLALDAAVPPIAFFVLVATGTLVASLGLAMASGELRPACLSGAALVVLGFSLVLAWWKAGRQTLSLGELLTMPSYILAKLPLYGRALVGKRLPWVRSRRD